jgi:hypothetical protein
LRTIHTLCPICLLKPYFPIRYEWASNKLNPDSKFCLVVSWPNNEKDWSCPQNRGSFCYLFMREFCRFWSHCVFTREFCRFWSYCGFDETMTTRFALWFQTYLFSQQLFWGYGEIFMMDSWMVLWFFFELFRLTLGILFTIMIDSNWLCKQSHAERFYQFKGVSIF